MALYCVPECVIQERLGAVARPPPLQAPAMYASGSVQGSVKIARVGEHIGLRGDVPLVVPGDSHERRCGDRVAL